MEDYKAAFVFIAIFYVMMLIPCVGIAWLGKRLIDQLGQFPSKTPVIQMGILFPLIMIEVVSFTIILAFFKVLTAQ